MNTAMKTISSQRYIDEKIVSEKIAAKDFEVAVSPSFEVDGETFRVVLDGHHSLEAARQAGVSPTYTEYTATEHDAIGLLDAGDVETFLEVVHMGDDYYDIETGLTVW